MRPVRTTTTLFAMLISGVAAAQTPPPEAPPEVAAPPPAPPAEPVPAPPMAPPPAPPPAAAPAQEAMVPPAQPALKIETPNKSSIKLGLLLQPQFQASQPRFGAATPAASAAEMRTGFGDNLYIRRTRILLGGTLFGVLDYFVDTDFPNLFLASNVTTTDAMGMMVTNSGVKSTPGMNIQDAFITYKAVGDLFKIDAGYMLPPLAHNAVQGATTLYSWDYFFYTFRSGNGFNSSANPIGRDAGFQLRGLVPGGRLEYRVGLFQGLRAPQTATDSLARNFFRVTGRVQLNLMDPETGFFYAGTYLGTKKVLSVGASFDLDDTGETTAYKYFAGDVFVDLPLGPAGVFTAQVNVAYWNGGTTIMALTPSATAVMGEAGFLFGGLRLSPILHAEHLFVSGDNNDDGYYGGGLAYWPYGHNTNLKAFYTYRKAQAAASGGSQVNVQWQLYFF